MSLGEGRVHVARLLDLLRFEDRRGQVTQLIEAQRIAEPLYARNGYASWHELPKHPLAAALLSHEQWLSGQIETTPSRLLALMEYAVAVNTFEDDWGSNRLWLAKRLRNENECLNALFEFMVANQLKAAGHTVRYQAESRGADLLIANEGFEVEVECILADYNTKRRVPFNIAMDLIGHLDKHMMGNDLHTIMLISCSDELSTRDVEPLRDAICELLDLGQFGTFDVLDGRYSVELISGGTTANPLTTEERDAILQRLNEAPVHWGFAESASQRIIVPNRHLVRGGVIRSELLDNALSGFVDSIVGKSHQLTDARPAVVAAGFGSPVAVSQSRNPAFLDSLGNQIQAKLESPPARPHYARREYPRISGVMLMFQVPGDPGPPIKSGLQHQQWEGSTVFFRRMPGAATPLPEDFTCIAD
jgi:hypothetical protein